MPAWRRQFFVDPVRFRAENAGKSRRTVVAFPGGALDLNFRVVTLRDAVHHCQTQTGRARPWS